MKKIALPVTSAHQIDDHFGHCEKYEVFTISDQNEILNQEIVQSEQGCGCKSNIAGVLADKGVVTMLAGGIGNGAINVLNRHGINVIRGCSGNAEEIVKLFLSDSLKDSGESCHQHETHSHGHNHEHQHQCNH